MSGEAIATLRRGLAQSPDLRRGLATTVFVAAAGSVGRIVIAVLLQQTIDRGIRNGEVHLGLIAALCSATAVVIVTAQLGVRLAVQRMGERSEQALCDLRIATFSHIHRLSGSQQNDLRKGALVARVTGDIESLAEFLSWGGLAWMLDIPLMMVTAVVMYLYDPLLATVVVVFAVPLVLLLRSLQQHLSAAYDIVRQRNAELLGEVSELVVGARTLRAYDASARRRDRAVESSDRLRRSGIRAGVWGALLFPVGELFAAVSIGSVVVLGLWRGADGGMTVGSLVGFVFLAYRFFDPVAELTEVLDQTQAALSGWRRVLDLLDTRPLIDEPAMPVALPPGPLAVDLRDITVRYLPRSGEADDEQDPALRDVTVAIPAGQRVAVVGATGSGKTTVARLIGRWLDPTEGTVAVGGVDLREVADADLRRRVLVVPQEPFLFTGSIRAAARLARAEGTDAEVLAAATSLGLADWITGLPDGLDTHVGERGDELSAGERQLVALLRAAVANPDCLVLDEATSSVDPAIEATVTAALDRLAAGRTTVIIAHRLSTAITADRVLVFDNGALVQDGPHRRLVDEAGPYADLFANWQVAVGTV